MKIKTTWGDSIVDVQKVDSFYCHVDVWKSEYTVTFVYKSKNSINPDTRNQIVAICKDFKEMMKMCKKVHQSLTFKFN